MADFGEFFCFQGGNLISSIGDASAEVRLDVADSWLVEAGKVRDLDAHFDRFERWVAQVDPTSAKQTGDFFHLVKLAIPSTGNWFPRIELHSEAPEGSRLFLRMREAPSLLSTATLWTFQEPDPRVNPLVKGPDLSLGMQMRRAAQMHGADEAVIISDSGFVAEGALSSLVWWDGDTLCAPGPEVAWLESITRNQVFAIADSMGLATKTENAAPEELAGKEIWLLSSLQGIRLVTDWVDLGARVGQPKYFDAFAKRLRMLSVSIH